MEPLLTHLRRSFGEAGTGLYRISLVYTFSTKSHNLDSSSYHIVKNLRVTL